MTDDKGAKATGASNILWRPKVRGLIFSVLVFSVFSNLLMLTGPLFMLQVYDRVLTSRSEETLLALFVLVAALYGLLAMFEFARGRVMARVGARLQSALDPWLLRSSLNQAVAPANRRRPATELRDVETVRAFLSSPVALAIFDAPWSIFFFAAIFILHPMLGQLGLLGAGVLFCVAVTNLFLTRKKTQRAQSLQAVSQGFSDQARREAELVRAQGMGDALTQRWLTMRDASLDQGICASDWTSAFTSLTKSFRLFLQSAMLALGAYLVLQDQLTAGAMIAGSILLGRAMAPIEQLLGQWMTVERALSGWRRLRALEDQVPQVSDVGGLPRPEARLSAKGLLVSRPEADRPILDNVSFDVVPGQALGVIGRSGSGKSTLAKLLVGITHVDRGDLRLGGATLDQFSETERGNHIGYLPQSVGFLPGTIEENIARMSTSPDFDQVVSAAQAAHAHELILSLPKGYQTRIGDADVELSGGQMQRVALARAFYGQPVLLVLDEPNSALDAEGSMALAKAIRAFKATGGSVVLMTHRPQGISECDKVLVLEQGKQRAFGPREEVLKAVLAKPAATAETGRWDDNARSA